METSAMERWSADTAAVHREYILVVEDELLVRIFISDALREAGYKVLEAFNGDEAVEILASGAHVDLVLSDVQMPGSVDGLRLLAFVRENYPGLPVVICSGHLNPEIAIQHGANSFLSKPYSVGSALEAVKVELEKPQ